MTRSLASPDTRDVRCGTCRYFGTATYITNGMRLFGQETTAEFTICKWTPPAPFWAAIEWGPLWNNERLDSARRQGANAGVGCPTWDAG